MRSSVTIPSLLDASNAYQGLGLIYGAVGCTQNYGIVCLVKDF